MKQSVKIFISCALGAFMGTLIALNVNHYFWWVGVLGGGSIGYLSYEFKSVLVGIKNAYVATQGWRPDTPAWKAKFRSGFAFLGMTQSLLFGAACLACYAERTAAPGRPLDSTVETHAGAIVFCFFTAMQVFSFLYGLAMPARNDKGKIVDLEMSYWTAFPPAAFLWWPLYGIYKLIVSIPAIYKNSRQQLARFGSFLKRFGWNLFVNIHSSVRLLCFVDAAIGTVIGFVCHHAGIGALVGGVLGVLNFELVSINWLRLVPTDQSLLARYR